MKSPWAFGALAFALLVSPAVAADADPGLVPALERAGEYGLAHPSGERQSSSTTGWVQGAFYTGLSHFDRSGLDGRHFDAALVAIGERNRWKLGPRLYHADDMCVGQTYLDLYETHHDPRMLAAMQERCDSILAKPKDDNLAFIGADKNNRWSWCDSLYMAPPAWVHLSAITGNPAYREYAVAHWWKTSAFLYNPAQRLFFRDSTYFAKKEKNGQPVFWSRGNGWVLAGLARVMEHLPANDPSRPKFEEQFREMAARVRGLQRPNGAWASSLLDPEDCRPDGEVSGTAFFTFAFAWGVNHGLLDAESYGPPARHAFAFLQTCEEPTGRMNHVQPIGAAPDNFAASATEAYGVGAYLLAGVEVARLGAGGGVGASR